MNQSLNLPGHIKLHKYSSVTSTNDIAKQIAKNGRNKSSDDWHIIWAESQTKGRGRYGRQWVSEPGNLFFSVLAYPKCAAETAALYSYLTALAICDALKSLVHDNSISLKWPNDVLIDNKKTAGILLESATANSSNMVAWLIIGVGININSYPKDADFPATSLEEQGYKAESLQLLENIIKSLIKLDDIFKKEGFEQLKQKWLEKAFALQEKITIKTADFSYTGIFEGINAHGSLILQLDSGETKEISSGEIF